MHIAGIAAAEQTAELPKTPNGEQRRPQTGQQGSALSKTTATASTSRGTKRSWRVIDEHMRADLVESALAMAVAVRDELARRVWRTLTAAVSTLARSWRDSPPAQFNPFRRAHLACCWENAAAESFWATAKVEFYD